MRIAYIFPSRSRKTKFFNTLDNIKIFSESDNFFIVAKLDIDDTEMNNPEVIEKLKTEYPDVIVKWNLSKSKVHACNRDLEDLPECDIIILQSDDMVWEQVGFDNEIREGFKNNFPNFDGVIHYPEEKSVDRTMVLTIMGINLYKQLGYLYEPSFDSVYCDNHLTEMTRKMGKYIFINKRLYSHRHPIWGLCEWDLLYRKNEDAEVYEKDRETFSKLKADNYGL